MGGKTPKNILFFAHHAQIQAIAVYILNITLNLAPWAVSWILMRNKEIKLKNYFPGQSVLIHLKMLFKQILIVILWLHPFKEHQLVVIGSKGSLHFEDSAENKPLLFYEKDSDPDLNLLSLKNKPSRKIDYEQTLPLTNELKYFVDVIRGKKIDKATFDEGLDVVKILEMATNSLTNKKLPVSPS